MLPHLIEEELIVGILTETNQFIQLSEPISEEEINPKYKNIPSFRNTNYVIDPKAKPIVQSDVVITTSNKVDKERVDYIKKIKFETNFYNVFRNTIRILLNDYENNEIKQQIEGEMFKEYIIYSQKLKNISKLLKLLINDKILFNGDDNYYKLIDEVSTCLVKDEDSCSKSPNLCVVTKNGKCKLILPERSLIAYDKIEKKGKLNEPIYLEKMADELIRYNRIKSFMLQPQTYLLFGNIGYNLRDNEIIMLQSLLTQEYFENITPVIINKYVKYNSYDEAEPIISQPYDDSSTNIIKNKMNECKNEPKPISSGKWKSCFPSSFKEIKYNKSTYCTFVFIIDLIEKKTGEKLSDNEIRNVLHKEYIKYFEDYHAQIIDNLIFEGKHKLGNYVKNPQVGEKIDELFLNLIYNTKYFLTTFDLWILVQKFQIPTIFISTSIKSLVKYNSDFFFIGYGNEDDDFAFIVVPGIDPVVVHGIDNAQPIILPAFKIIETNSSDIFISLDKLLDCDYKNKFIESFKNKNNIENFLRNFSKKIRIETSENSEHSDDDEQVKKPKKATAKQSLVEGSIAIPENKEPVITKEKTKKNKKDATKGKTKKVKSK